MFSSHNMFLQSVFFQAFRFFMFFVFLLSFQNVWFCREKSFFNYLDFSFFWFVQTMFFSCFPFVKCFFDFLSLCDFGWFCCFFYLFMFHIFHVLFFTLFFIISFRLCRCFFDFLCVSDLAWFIQTCSYWFFNMSVVFHFLMLSCISLGFLTFIHFCFVLMLSGDGFVLLERIVVFWIQQRQATRLIMSPHTAAAKWWSQDQFRERAAKWSIQLEHCATVGLCILSGIDLWNVNINLYIYI